MPTQRLTPEMITTAALGLIDADGPDALTMRGLAERLGVGTMTLYGYFRSRDELLDAVVDTATAAALDGAPDGPPDSALTSLFTALHEVLTRHPGLPKVRGSRPFLSPGVLRLTDRALSHLTVAGLDQNSAVRAYRTLYLFTLGCVTYARQDPADTRRALRTLPADDFDHLRSAADTMVAVAGAPGEFSYGLSLLITAVTAKGAGVRSATPGR